MKECNMRFPIPVLLTLARFVLIAPLIWAITQEAWGLALAVLLVAGVTDVLDGYLARAWGQETILGACLDPLADKALLIALYATLLVHGVAGFVTPTWFFVFLVIRELIIVFGVFIFGIVRHDLAIRPTVLGKVTTVGHLCFISVLFLAAACNCMTWTIVPLFWTVTLLVSTSLVQYVLVGIRGIRW